MSMLMASYAFGRRFASSQSWRSVTCTRTWRRPSKKGLRAFDALPSSTGTCMARLWIAKHAWADTLGLSVISTALRPSTRGWNASGGTELAWSSQMRPRVQAVVSLTMVWGSLRAPMKNPTAWLTYWPMEAWLGPSRMEQKAMVLASRNLQSSLLMYWRTKGMTTGTTLSFTVSATRLRHVEAAIERFQMLSSRSASSSCFVRPSRMRGMSWASAASM
mmetsp:Transcript_9466/g.18914  ORF Transcript_9466/g.18914 Transcript_9466/m.18914 type:complete len:218 (-) Transcript_9466:990-1643(-)